MRRFIQVILLFAPLVAYGQNLMKLNALFTGLVTVANAVVTLLFVVVLGVFAWGIVKFIAAAGDTNKVREARGILTWGVIALAVLASLYGVVKYLQDLTGVDGGMRLMFPIPIFT